MKTVGNLINELYPNFIKHRKLNKFKEKGNFLSKIPKGKLNKIPCTVKNAISVAHR